MQQHWSQREIVSVLELFIRVRSLVLWSVLLALSAQHVAAQARPVLRNPKRDFLAGRLVLIPASAQPDAMGLPRQLAQIADHELRTPPASLLPDDQVVALNRWASEYDFAEADGLLVAADKLSATTLQAIRARHRHLSIFGFGSSLSAQLLLAAGTLDFLLFTGQSATSVKLPPDSVDRVGYLASETNASGLLLARWLNHRFGFAPQFQLAFSSGNGSALSSSLARQVAALGGNVVTREASHLRVFIHTPQTSEPERAAMVNALVTLTTNGVRVALIDANDQAEDRAAMFAALRERKLLDRLTAYAAVSAQAQSAEAACQRALTQANMWLIALRFLRDDIERIRRTERNQIAASISAYLREAIYPTLSFETSGTLAEREARVQTALRPQADTLFNEQFYRNVHAVLLNTNERVEFQLRLLQRLQVRLPNALEEATNAPEIRPEIRVDVNLVLLESFLIARDFPRAGWELNNAASLDPRIIARFEAIAWQTFRMDVNDATITIKLTNKATNDPQTAQGYSLNSRRGGETRRLTINAATAQGAFYALAQLEHLGANGQLAQDFQFTEKPAVAERGYVESADAAWSHRERLDLLRLAGRARLNVFAYSSSDNNAARMRELNQTAYENFVTLVNAPPPPSRFTLQSCEASPLGAWTLAMPSLESKNGIATCAPASARVARLPLAWFGALGWSGKSLNSAAALSVTLNWLYEGKAREALRPWLEANALASFDHQASEINAPLLTDKLNQLQATLPQFDTTREQGLLRGVLRAFLQEAQQRLSALAEDNRYERTETGAYRRRSRID